MHEKEYSLAARSRANRTEEEWIEHRKFLEDLVRSIEDGTCKPFEPKVYTGEERLAYYRAHGLTCCEDYPGGDERFEADVRSGEYRDERVTLEPLKREDAYIIQCFKDGRLKVTDSMFLKYGVRPEVELAMYDSMGGVVIHRDYDPGYTYQDYRREVLSGEYAKKHLDEVRYFF